MKYQHSALSFKAGNQRFFMWGGNFISIWKQSVSLSFVLCSTPWTWNNTLSVCSWSDILIQSLSKHKEQMKKGNDRAVTALSCSFLSCMRYSVRMSGFCVNLCAAQCAGWQSCECGDGVCGGGGGVCSLYTGSVLRVWMVSVMNLNNSKDLWLECFQTLENRKK